MKRIALWFLVIWVVLPSAYAADWNQWRGPDRNGYAPKGPELAGEWPKTGLKKLWDSEEKFPGGGHAGYGSVTVADGRLYFFSQQGKATVLKAGRTLEVLGTNTLDSGFMASPAASGKALFLSCTPEEAKLFQESSVFHKFGVDRCWHFGLRRRILWRSRCGLYDFLRLNPR